MDIQRSSYDKKYEPIETYLKKEQGKIVETKLTKIKEINPGSPTKSTDRYEQETLEAKLEEDRSEGKLKEKSFGSFFGQKDSQPKFRQYSQGYENNKNYQQMDSSPVCSEYHLVSQEKSQPQGNNQNKVYLQNSGLREDKRIKTLSSKYF